MAYKKKLNPTSIQINKSINEIPEKRDNKSTGLIQTWSFRIAETS